MTATPHTTARPAHPVRPIAETRLRAVHAELGRGLLLDWQERNATATVPHAIHHLHAYGHVDNLLRLRTGERLPFRGHVFADSDVHKALEGIAWTPPGVAATDAFFERMIDLLEDVQADDGYLNSAFQGWDAGAPAWSDFAQGHELYAFGHLIQAGIAASRNGRGSRLLDVGRRAADLAVRLFGAADAPHVPGHPEIEMALVELYRETGERSYLDLASAFVERRGNGWLGDRPHGPYYYQDAVPLREMTSLHGHAVRAAYLCAGATDVAVETGDAALLAHLGALWDDMTRTKVFITGGVGSRHRDEAFGDAYELPSERAYAETCAAIGLVHWAWRLLIATGGAQYASYVERALFNAVAVSCSTDGRAFFYSNPLQRRADHLPSQEEGAGHRLPWFDVSCCPPNIMRTMATLQDYLATTDGHGLQVHLPAASTIRAEVDGGPLAVRLSGDYPWSAELRLEVLESPQRPWQLDLRMPEGTTEVAVDGVPHALDEGYLRVARQWTVGDVLQVSAQLRPRIVRANPRVDALRGSVAVVLGPLVMCVEDADADGDLDDLRLDASSPLLHRPRGLEGDDLDTVLAQALVVPASDDLYSDAFPGAPSERRQVGFRPYFAWGNRGTGAMRVWVPADDQAPIPPHDDVPLPT